MYKKSSQPAAPRKRPTLYYSLEDITSSGLLSEARLAELNAEIDRRISMPRTEGGHVITSSRVIDLRSPTEGADNPKLFIYPRVETGDYQDKYIRKEILNVILTDEEAFMIYDYCHSANRERRKERLFNEAKKIPASEWDGWVCHGDDSYHESVEDFMDAWVSDNQDWDDATKTFVTDPETLANKPTFVWAARPQVVVPQLDISDMLERWTDVNGWEDLDIDATFKGLDTVRAALDAFVKENEGIVSYMVDEKTAVLLDWSEGDKIANE